jgi:putative CocE/NonD family hydrolase
LTADKTLSTAGQKGAAEPLAIRFDPANPVPTVGGHILNPDVVRGAADQREKVESRADVLVFTTPVLKQDLALAGKVSADLYVSSDRPDTDFSVILTDVYPDGRSILVSEGIQRMRFRESTSAENLMKPGEIYRIKVELPNTAITFQKGHRLRAIVSSSDYPKYSANPNDGGALYDRHAGVVASNKVYVDAQHSSAIVLPVEGGDRR